MTGTHIPLRTAIAVTIAALALWVTAAEAAGPRKSRSRGSRGIQRRSSSAGRSAAAPTGRSMLSKNPFRSSSRGRVSTPKSPSIGRSRSAAASRAGRSIGRSRAAGPATPAAPSTRSRGIGGSGGSSRSRSSAAAAIRNKVFDRLRSSRRSMTAPSGSSARSQRSTPSIGSRSTGSRPSSSAGRSSLFDSLRRGHAGRSQRSTPSIGSRSAGSRPSSSAGRSGLFDSLRRGHAGNSQRSTPSIGSRSAGSRPSSSAGRSGLADSIRRRHSDSRKRSITPRTARHSLSRHGTFGYGSGKTSRSPLSGIGSYRSSGRRSLAGSRRSLGIRFEDRRPSRHHLSHRGGHRRHVYRDRHRKLHNRSVDADFRFAVFYGSGRSRRARWVYPYYHRKYVFVSLNGSWPRRRCPRRYYWYGWHPYRWYGYNPVPYVIHNDTSVNVFYTYNYDRLDDYHPYDDGITIDAYEPVTQTEADIYFQKGVEEFADEDYDDAARYFYTAMRLDAADPVIPYAYVQALFADEEYRRAAGALRGAVAYLDPEDNGVFFPRGLYAEDEELFDQIEDLEEEVEDEYRDMDARLLLGYQLLGIGEREIAREVLLSVRYDMVNGRAAEKLLRLIDVIG